MNYGNWRNFWDSCRVSWCLMQKTSLIPFDLEWFVFFGAKTSIIKS